MMAVMTPDERGALLMLAEGYTGRETAAAFGHTPGWVTWTKHKARAALVRLAG
jgi:hypothetical protein